MSKRTITIEVPDWGEERRVYIFLGRECYALSEADGTLYVKTERCNRCGKCCRNPGLQFPKYIPEGEDQEYCAYCIRMPNGEWECENPLTPFGCLKDSGRKLPHPECVMKYKKE